MKSDILLRKQILFQNVCINYVLSKSFVPNCPVLFFGFSVLRIFLSIFFLAFVVEIICFQY